MCLAPSPTILSTDEVGSVAPPIFTSVGQDAVNGPGDVFVIQSLLNKRLPQPHTDVRRHGRDGPGHDPGDQGVPGGDDEHESAERPGRAREPDLLRLGCAPAGDQGTPPPPTPFGHIGIVPPEVIEAAKASQRQWGVPASVTLAQWIVESAWGSAMPPDSNNPFGIKALETQPAVESETREVIDGKVIITTARFRRFDSLSEAFESAWQVAVDGGAVSAGHGSS